MSDENVTQEAQPEVEAADAELLEPEVEESPLEIAQAESARLLEQLRRAAADLENVRRRHRKELSDVRLYGQEPVLSDMAGVNDDFLRVLEHVDAVDDSNRELVEGVKLISEKLIQALAKHGMTSVGVVGEAFDPARHDALQRQEDPTVPKNTVLVVFQRGYQLNDRIVRPAGVVVSTGGPERVVESPDTASN